MNTFYNLPDLIVFDLDFTLWPFWVDTHVSPPFQSDCYGKIYDSRRTEVKCYSEVPQILLQLHRQGAKMAIASRTTCTSEANDLVRLFNWDQFFVMKQIYPGNKTTHFRKFSEMSGIPLSRMLFFDDEQRNITDVSALGVTAIHVKDGMSINMLQHGLAAFAQRCFAAQMQWCQMPQ